MARKVEAGHLSYGAYGELLSRSGTTNTSFLFNGQWGVQADANGIYFHRARYYHPQLRRFLNQDPVGFEGGLNWYVYAEGNPIRFIDPLGLKIEIYGDASYKKQVRADLETARKSDPALAALISQLETSDLVHGIGPRLPGSEGEGNSSVPTNYPLSSLGIRSGSITRYDPNDSNGWDVRPPVVGLVHELAHARDADCGKLTLADKWKNDIIWQSEAERRAVDAENIMRRALHLPRRWTYKSVPLEPAYGVAIP